MVGQPRAGRIDHPNFAGQQSGSMFDIFTGESRFQIFYIHAIPTSFPYT